MFRRSMYQRLGGINTARFRLQMVIYHSGASAISHNFHDMGTT